MTDSRRTTRRTFLTSGAAVASGLGLAGCMTNSGTTNSTGNTTGNGSSSNSGSNSNTIDIWLAWGGYYESIYDEMLGQFESQYPEYNINYTSKGNYRETLNAVFTAAQANNEPDIAHLGSGATVSIMDSGVFEPISDIAGSQFNASDYTGASVRPFEIGGKVRALPFGSSQIIMFYNRSLFEDAGLDPESPPGSLEALQSASQTIVDSGAAEYGITWPNAAWWPLSWMQEMGQPLTDAENGHAGEPSTLHLTSDASMQIARWYEGMAESGLYMNPGIESWSPARQAFITGDSAMHMTSVGSMAGELSAANENGIDLGTAALPTPSGSGMGHNAGTAALWARSGLSGEKREVVRDLMLFLTNPEQQAYWHKSTGYYPTNKGAIDQLESEGWYEENPAFGVAKEQLLSWEDSVATRGAAMGSSAQITRIIAEQQERMFQDGTDAETAMQTAKEEGERVLEQYDRA